MSRGWLLPCGAGVRRRSQIPSGGRGDKVSERFSPESDLFALAAPHRRGREPADPGKQDDRARRIRRPVLNGIGSDQRNGSGNEPSRRTPHIFCHRFIHGGRNGKPASDTGGPADIPWMERERVRSREDGPAALKSSKARARASSMAVIAVMPASVVRSCYWGSRAIRLFRYVLEVRPHVIHGFLPLNNFLGALAGRVAFVPLIITSKRALGTHQDRHPELKWMDRLANAASHIVTANSHAVARTPSARDGYDISRIVVIPNGVDFARFDQPPGQRDEVRQKLGLSQDEHGHCDGGQSHSL